MRKSDIFNTVMAHTVGVISMSILFGLAAMLTGCHHASKPEERTPEISVATPQVDSVTTHKEFPATLQAASSADVVARVNGVIRTCNYKPGDRVAKGAVLFTIESTQYADAVTQARARLESARSQHSYASRQYEALKKALAADAASEMDVIQAENSRRTAEADIREAQAALRDAETTLSYCTVRAPISGVITDNAIEPGNYVAGGNSPVTLAHIYDESSYDVVFNITEDDYRSMLAANGGVNAPIFRTIPLRFSVPLNSNYTASLYYDSPAVDATSGNMQLKAAVNNTDGELKDGMYCTVALPSGVNPKAILVKDASLGSDELGKYLYIVNDSDKVVVKHVKTGELVNDSMRIVTSGITPKDRYVTRALLKVRAGETVKPLMEHERFGNRN